jgi:tRNA-dihydrouridine synthase B
MPEPEPRSPASSEKVLKIRDLVLSSPVILAPMAGISDLPFRNLNRRFGCELAFTEMISARALVYRNVNTLRMLSSDPLDSPLGVQLLGNDSTVMIRALDILRSYRCDVIDVNAACPAGKVIKRGEGAALLREPRNLFRLLKAVVEKASLPVTLKIRLGWDETSVNAREVALYAQDAGIAAVFVHGRTKEQGYSGKVDYNEIRRVREALSIPVIASGDAFSAALIRKILDETGCDGVAIARGALGNPWIFRETIQYLKEGIITGQHEINEIMQTMILHLDLAIEAEGERSGTTKFRKFFAWYVRGLHDTRTVRAKAFRAETRRQMADFIFELRTSHFRNRLQGRPK